MKKSIMGRNKIPSITSDEHLLRETMVNMIGVSSLTALSPSSLFIAIEMLPLQTQIIYDKIYGRWIFTTEHEDDWASLLEGNHCSGANFSFVEKSPEIAMAKGIHYYYHTRIKQ